MHQILKLIMDGIPENTEIAVAFSGGIDSSLLSILAKMKNNSVRLYTLSLDSKSPDLEYSRRFSKDMGFELVEVGADDVIELFNKWDRIVGRVKAEVMVGVEIILRAAHERDVIFGSGSEEVFAGYDRHYRSENLKDQLRKEFEELEHNEIRYTRETASRYNKNVIFPFYNKELFDFVMLNYTEQDLLRDPIRKKAVLREIAKQILPEYIVNRPKKALQYGSKINKIVSKFLSSNSEQ